MSNVLSDDKRQQIIALGQLGWSLRRMEQATGVRRETASSYLKAAGLQVRPPGWGRAKPAIEVTTDSEPKTADKRVNDQAGEVAKPAIGVTTDFAVPKPPIKQPPATQTLSNCEPYREFIQESLGRGRNATAIYQDLVTDYGFAHSYQSVKRFVNKLCPPELKPARAVIITAPGEEAQVDYGTGPWVRDPQSGKYRRKHLFAHYGAVALPCRVKDPDRKGKVEAGVGHAQKTPLKGQRFESLEAAQAYLDRWETNWADTRIHG